MCGIFGFIGNEGKSFKMDSLASIASVTERRGKHAWGMAWIDEKGRIHSYKSEGAVSDHLDKLEMAEGALALIGHCRYATHGTPSANINNHPHPCDGGWMTHNGVVENYEELLNEHNLYPSSSCDSETIALLTEREEGSRLARVASAVEYIQSYRLAVMALWARPTTLVIVKRGNPLSTCETKRGMYFGSLPEGMPKLPLTMTDNCAYEFTHTKGGKIHVTVRSIPAPVAE